LCPSQHRPFRLERWPPSTGRVHHEPRLNHTQHRVDADRLHIAGSVGRINRRQRAMPSTGRADVDVDGATYRVILRLMPDYDDKRKFNSDRIVRPRSPRQPRCRGAGPGYGAIGASPWARIAFLIFVMIVLTHGAGSSQAARDPTCLLIGRVAEPTGSHLSHGSSRMRGSCCENDRDRCEP
jgi:hypothetical protein